MPRIWIHLPNRSPREYAEGSTSLTFGRASACEVVIEDASISRNHAKLAWKDGGLILEDLGSRNGTRVNSVPITGPQAVKPGDDIRLGTVQLRLEGSDQPAVRVESAAEAPGSVSMLMRVDQLRNLRGTGEGDATANRWRDALSIVHEMSLDLLGDQPVQPMLDRLLERLFSFLAPTRGAILLRQNQGPLESVAVRTRQGTRETIRLSRTMVEAAVERKEAMLVNNPMLDDRLAQAASLVQSGTTSIMTVPLEYEGEVVGLVYLDAGPQRPLFTEEDLTFVAAMGHLAAAKIQQTRMAEEVRKKRDQDKELALARQIQQRLLPSAAPILDGYELFGINVPCKQVSGDLFGYWPRPDGKLWIVIADVAGKGVGPGLLMATFQAYMQAWSESDMGSAELAGKISTSLGRSTTPNRYITAFLALLDPATGQMESTNAGHNPILLLRADGRRELLESQGFPLAMFPGGSYGQDLRALEPGDLLTLYTDGIGEAAGPDDNDFGLDGLEAVLLVHRNQPLAELHLRIQEAIDAHTGGSPLADDRTLVMVKRTR